MLESENASLLERVADLEQRVISQQDEIVCMRSTLADVLRRLNVIDGNSERSANSSFKNSTPGSGSANSNASRSSSTTPTRNGVGLSSFNRMSTTPSPTPSGMNASPADWKLKKPIPREQRASSSEMFTSLRKTSSSTSTTTTLNQR